MKKNSVKMSLTVADRKLGKRSQTPSNIVPSRQTSTRPKVSGPFGAARIGRERTQKRRPEKYKRFEEMKIDGKAQGSGLGTDIYPLMGEAYSKAVHAGRHVCGSRAGYSTCWSITGSFNKKTRERRRKRKMTTRKSNLHLHVGCFDITDPSQEMIRWL